MFSSPTQKRWTQQIIAAGTAQNPAASEPPAYDDPQIPAAGLSDNQLHSIIFFISDCTISRPYAAGR